MRSYGTVKPSGSGKSGIGSSVKSDVGAGTLPEKIKDKKTALDEVLNMSRPKKDTFNPHGVTWND